MDINPLHLLQGGALWVVGATAGAFVTGWIGKKAHEYEQIALQTAKQKLESIQNDNLRQAARYAVRFIAQTMPTASNSAKLKAAIKVAQEATPNFIVSDDKVRVIAEAEYMDFKQGLANI